MLSLHISPEHVRRVRPDLEPDQIADTLAMIGAEQDKILKDAIEGVTTWLFPQYQRAIKLTIS